MEPFVISTKNGIDPGTVPPLGSLGDIVNVRAADFTGAFLVATWNYAAGTPHGGYGTINVVSGQDSGSTSREMGLFKSGARPMLIDALNMTSGINASERARLRVGAADLVIENLTCTGTTNSAVDLNLDQSTVFGRTTLTTNVDCDIADAKTVEFGDVSVGAASSVLTLTNGATPTGTADADSMVVDADAAGAARALDMDGAGTLTVNGDITVKPDQDAANAASLDVSAGSLIVASRGRLQVYGGGTTAVEGTVQISGGTLDPADFYLFGGSSTSHEALLVVGSGSTLTNPDSFIASGFCAIDTEESYTVDGEMRVEPRSSDTFNTDVDLDIATTKTVAVGSLVVAGNSARTAKFTVTLAGTAQFKTQ